MTITLFINSHFCFLADPITKTKPFSVCLSRKIENATMESSSKVGQNWMEQNLTLAKVSNQKYAIIDVPERFSVSMTYNRKNKSISCDNYSGTKTWIKACDLSTYDAGSVY